MPVAIANQCLIFLAKSPLYGSMASKMNFWGELLANGGNGKGGDSFVLEHKCQIESLIWELAKTWVI
jgi:hypothetical protein